MFIILGADGKEYGPVKARIVHEWLAEGRANLETKARRSDSTDWKTLADFAEFADQHAAQAAPPFAAEPPPLHEAADASSAAPATSAADTTPAPAAPAPRELRLAAAFVDGVLKVACLLPMMLPVYAFAQERAREGGLVSFQEAFENTNVIVAEHFPKSFPFMIALLLVQAALITLRGQSIGKMLLRLRIVRNDNNAPAGLVRGFLLRSALPWLVQQIPLAGQLFWVVDTCFIFRADHRCLHDLAAGTKVVSVSRAKD